MSEYREHLDMVPSHMHAAICSWIENPVHPVLLGSFLRALLTNDLKGAILNGDEQNVAALQRWVEYLYNYAPSPCWGSDEKVSAWYKRHEIARVAAP